MKQALSYNFASHFVRLVFMQFERIKYTMTTAHSYSESTSVRRNDDAMKNKKPYYQKLSYIKIKRQAGLWRANHFAEFFYLHE